jgi:hypothetical protein
MSGFSLQYIFPDSIGRAEDFRVNPILDPTFKNE